MKLKSLNKYISFLILFISFQFLYAEEEIDIWNKEIKEKSQTIESDNDISNNTINSEIFKKSQTNNKIKIKKINLIIILNKELPKLNCRLYLSCIIKKYI